MTKKQLVTISLIRDMLDLALVGQVPGLNWLLNAPVLLLHYRYAGPIALATLLENIPGVGVIPCFTAAAISYLDRDAVIASERKKIPIIEGEIIDPPANTTMSAGAKR